MTQTDLKTDMEDYVSRMSKEDVLKMESIMMKLNITVPLNEFVNELVRICEKHNITQL